MNDPPKIVTQSINPFLQESFRAFTAEGLPFPIAAAMTAAHVNHAAAKAQIDQARALERIADVFENFVARTTDPVRLGGLLAMVKAGDEKRAERKDERAKEGAIAALTGKGGNS